MLKIIVFLFAFFTFQPSFAKDFTIAGSARVIDGDTLEIGQQKIRLEGIDAPEREQLCGSSGNPIYCGQQASYELESLIQNNIVKCIGVGTDKYRRVLGECYLNDIQINEWMVKSGWALAYRKYSTKYVQSEEDAKNKGLGIWRFEFIEPWNWRAAKRALNNAKE